MPVLKTLVEPETKTRFRRKAKTRGLSESELLRALVLAELGQNGDAGQPVEPCMASEEINTERMTLRMPGYLRKATKTKAKSKGMTPSRYVAALVQSNYTGKPVLTDDELTALRVNIRELAAIGRNINQIARVLNASFHEKDLVQLDALADLGKLIERNRAVTQSFINASQNAWESGQCP
ncbi:plasmid mobilization relaxosome protein MobC [Sulfuriferula sp.]|uniref:plasmid mobilization relaxosome protein MobC n=1 Tax=Sulfuriferula sp. TaxID=2025307 RepID=UPI0027300A38|nr:plasmid mobilization relaxosome protein MobC [Sulfuriferula sp.]MDP2027885.1 plasmid mobilization relaxosome protein MobC [Sulfuriferula sp.]